MVSGDPRWSRSRGLPLLRGTWDGRFMVKRKAQSQRLTRKLTSLRQEARLRMHAPVAVQHRWLCQVQGHYAYYGLRSYYRSLDAFHQGVQSLWFRALPSEPAASATFRTRTEQHAESDLTHATRFAQGDVTVPAFVNTRTGTWCRV